MGFSLRASAGRVGRMIQLCTWIVAIFFWMAPLVQAQQGFHNQPCLPDSQCGRNGSAGDCTCRWTGGWTWKCMSASNSPTCTLAAVPAARPLATPPSNINLMQPLDDTTTSLAPEPGINIFFRYFNLSWPWILGVAAGIAVLQAIIGGLQIMLSGGSEQKSAGQSRLTWALAGLALVALAGFILRVLNPIFFR